MGIGKKISLAAVLAILAAAGYGGYTVIKKTDLAALRSGKAPSVHVSRVVDGDTIELSDGDIVRLVGIDAPDRGECYFEESSAALRKLVEGKSVKLLKDVTEADDFGRLLRYAILPRGGESDLLVDEYLVREGYAEPQTETRDKLYLHLLVAARDEAIREKRGLWGACDGVRPSERAQADTRPPSPTCTVKGNISAENYGRTYFIPGCKNYAQVKIDPARGEQYFCSEAAAIDAGFVKATFCP